MSEDAPEPTINMDAVTIALGEVCSSQAVGRYDTARAWAAELCRLLLCEDIVNARGWELRHAFHAGPRNPGP